MLDFNDAHVFSRRGPDGDDVKDRVTRDLEAYLKWLYGNAVIIGRAEARLGNLQGDVGESLSISLRGENRGQWIDHATGETGDPLTLYMERRGYRDADFDQALQEIAKDFLHDPIEAKSDAGDWLKKHNAERKTANEKAHKAREQMRLDGKETIYPYHWPDGSIAFKHIRTDFPDGTKTFRFSPTGYDGPRPFYRMPELVDQESIVLVEGEKCADALWGIGVPATTLAGGSNTKVDKIDWSFVGEAKVIVWRDNDPPGIKWEESVTEALRKAGASITRVPVEIWFAGKPAGYDAADALAEAPERGPEIVASLRAIQDEGQGQKASADRFTFLSLDELAALPPVEFILDDYLTEGGLSSVFGRPGAGKSFVALDMALSIAYGQDWHGKKVKPGTVAYMAGEGSRGIRHRVLAWQQNRLQAGKMGPAGGGFFVLPLPADIIDKSDRKGVVAGLGKLPSSPRLVIVDTLARYFGKGDENAQKDMNAFVEVADMIRETFNCHVMIIHHSGIADPHRGRGSSVLKGALDTEIEIDRANNRQEWLSIVCHKQKDAEEPRPLRMGFKVIGMKDPVTGIAGTSRVLVEYNEDDIIDKGAPDVTSMTPRQVAIVEVMRIANDWLSTSMIASQLGKENAKNLARELNFLASVKAIQKKAATKEFWWKVIRRDEASEGPPEEEFTET